MREFGERRYIGMVILVALLACVFSSYFFPVGFRGLPESLNSKQMLGVLGIGLFALNCIERRSVIVPKYGIVSLALAVVFSVWCFYSAVANNTDDYVFAQYVMSFAVWTGGAYATCRLIGWIHGYVDLPLLTRYLALACVMQCAFAMMVDNIPAFQSFVDTWFIQDTTAKELERLYGIGCSLDSGGVRMCIALIMIAHQIATNREVTENRMQLRLYLLAYLIICVVGSMISRTTWAGMFLGIGYMLLYMGYVRQGYLSARQVRFFAVLTVLIAVVIAAAAYLYNHDPVVRHNLRFAFEGFFNFVEHGEFQVDSVDELNGRMWIWPYDTRGWAIGYGVFEWSKCFFQTDIGYCRYTMYCGLIGLALFSIYFIYNGITVSVRFRNAAVLSLLLILLTFIVWVKVATDIFQLYALLFCITGDYEMEEQ